MSVNAQPQKSFILRVLRGPDKGAIFKLIGKTVRIGRGPDNDVILTDPKCSRSQAVITFSEGSIVIENLSTNNVLELDGSKTSKSFLNPGSVIAVGNSQIKFDEMTLLPSNLKNTSISSAGIRSPNIRTTTSAPNQGRLFFYLIVMSVALLGIWLFSGEKTTNQEPQLHTEADIDQSIENSKRKQEELYRQQAISQKNSQQYQEANAAYLKGLRDYREGHYTRALQSFSAALAIFPNHELAQNYYNLAKKRHDELVQFTFNEALRFMEQNKYNEALASFQNVMILINDPNNKMYQEAREKYNETNLIIKSSN